jgi:TonB family protein
MALRALFFSRNPDTVDALTPALQEAGIRADVCADIFNAIEKGTKQPFACVIADWVDQPEAGFLLKRARESGPNRNAVAIVIVDGDPSPEEEREHRLDFLIYRPISADEVRAVLAKARQQMQLHAQAFATDPDTDASLDRPEIQEPAEPTEEDPNLVAVAADLPETLHPADLPDATEDEGTFAEDYLRPRPSRLGSAFRVIAATLLVAVAAYFLWAARPTIQYLATTREGVLHIFKDSIAALFYVNRSGARSVSSVAVDAQQDAYFNRRAVKPGSSTAPINVISAEVELPHSVRYLHTSFDFPLPTPELHVDPLPQPVRRAPLPDSLRSSAPITPPPSLTVTPGQMMPVSTPPPVVPLASQYGDSVRLTEQAARALAIHTVDPSYPPEARAQKLQGSVVLQTVIGRDGSVQDVKLVRGYFILAKAAIAALKQWRFKPSTINGRPVEAQTTITLNFTYPSS